MFGRLIAGAGIAAAVVFGSATATSADSGTALERTENAGWTCADIAGAMHCFDPGDSKSSNSKTLNVKVYNYAGEFLGTEHIWLKPVNGPRQCPQDVLLDLGFGYACHHYAQS
jgi:hypothetical protein